MKAPKEIREIVDKMEQIVEWTGNPSIIYATALYFNQTMWELITYGILKPDEIPGIIEEMKKIAEVPENGK